MTPDMVPNPGPEMETVYIPGNPGGQWTPEEIDSTRRRVTQMIHPDWEMKLLMGTADTRLGHFLSGFPGCSNSSHSFLHERLNKMSNKNE